MRKLHSIFIQMGAISVLLFGCSLEVSSDSDLTGYSNDYYRGADDSQASTVAIAHINKTTNELIEICSGVLVRDHYFLTAAHCKVEKGDKLVFGRSIGSSGSQISYPEKLTRTVTSTANFDFKPETYENDIQIVYVEEELPKGYRPVSLNGDLTLIQPGNQILSVGYGTRKSGFFGTKQPVPLSAIGFNEVVPGFDEMPDSPEKQEAARLSKKFIFAKGDEAASICSGDSGGPVFSNGLLVGLIAGMVGGKCGESKDLFITKIAAYHDVITNALDRMEKATSQKKAE